MRRLVCAVVFGVTIGLPAWAGGASDAEHHRLSEEMVDLEQRGAWAGVDRAFVALDSLGGPLTHAELWRGAQAAKTLGNVSDAWARFERAQAVEWREDGAVELALLFAEYGLVSVQVSKKLASSELTAADIPFDPVPRRAIEAAASALKADRRYYGLLPLGRYQISGTVFEVVGEPLVVVRAR